MRRPTQMKTTSTVFVVDDDARVLKALVNLLQNAGFNVKAFADAETFLEKHDPTVAGCVLCDMAMPGIDGLQLQQELANRGARRPLVFLTGKGTIPSTVRAIKEGASNYLTKPVDEAVLFKALRTALDTDARERDLRARVAGLTPREREVLEHLGAGQLGKQIAGDIGVSASTVKFHKNNLVKKLGVKSAAHLVRLGVQAGIIPKLPDSADPSAGKGGR